MKKTGVDQVKEFLMDFLFMLAGSIIYAIGINGFTAPNNIDQVE